MISSAHTESEEQRKMMKVLSDELSYFRSFARMEETKICHIEKELTEASDVREEMRTLKSDLARCKDGIELLQEKEIVGR